MYSPREQIAAEWHLLGLRWFAAAFACIQVATFYMPYPAGVEAVAWLTIALYATWLLAITVAARRAAVRPDDPRLDARLGFAGLVADGLFATALSWVYAFDPSTAVFAMLYIVAVEGAYRYGMRGALVTMLALGIGYALRDAWAAWRYDIDFLPASISFRVGVGFLVAAVAGSMSERARREHLQLQRALRSEQRAAEALRSLDELRSTFLSAVSHELRTPLTSILGFAMTVRDRAPELSDLSRDLLDQVVDQSRRLERLLEDLTEIERMGRGGVPMSRRRLDVAELVRLRVEAIRIATGRMLEFADEQVAAVVDRDKVERVVDNLLGNAIKYSPEHTVVRVGVERRAGGVLLRVDDDGPGVPRALRDSIFEPFERGALTSMHKPGTGIGLSLVDRFARLHGGRAWVEDCAGDDGACGASFRVYLPDGPVGDRIVTIASEPWDDDGEEPSTSAGGDVGP